LVQPYQLILLWKQVKDKFEIWRLYTSLIYAGGFSFNFAMHTLVLYENCKRYESNPYNTGAGGNSADMLWMLFLTSSLLHLISYNFDLMLLSEALLYVIMYVWSRREPNVPLNIFGLRLKSMYLPWAYVAIRLLMGGSITEALLGIVVGHIYYFLVEVLPVSHGYTLIKTPKFCMDAVQWVAGFLPSPIGSMVTPMAAPGRTTNPAAPPGSAATGTAQRTTGYQWGRGRALGAN